MKTASFQDQEISLMQPQSTMGSKVHSLVSRCPPLDTNSIYCNILQCDHFSETSCAALTADGDLVGFISAFLPPKDKNKTLFIWQVAVDSSQRGKNLGMKMMLEILSREVCQEVTFLQTTVTESNKASCAMFEKLSAKLCQHSIQKKIIYDSKKHFNGKHDSEVLFNIGPFDALN